MCMVKWEWGPVTRGRAGGELGPLLGSVAIIGGIVEICVESGVDSESGACVGCGGTHGTGAGLGAFNSSSCAWRHAGRKGG